MSSIIECLAVSKYFGERPAVERATLTIQMGERVALLGENGSGKTTLLRLIAGTAEPTDGHITVAGHPSGSRAARAALSFVPDAPALYDDLSLLEHAEYIAGMHRIADWRTRTDQLVERLGLRGREDDLPSTFSRGLRQKTMLLLAFLRPAQALLVDEPFVGLDTDGQQALLDLLDDAAAAGTAVVVATHQSLFVERDPRIVRMHDGHIVSDH